MVFCNGDLKDVQISRKSCHNPYFNRWFSAITFQQRSDSQFRSHNPYFNRWFSAIKVHAGQCMYKEMSQSLF